MMIYEPTEAEIFHYGGARHSHLYNRNDQSLCAATAGGYRRGLGMRMAAMGGEDSVYDYELEYLESSNENQYIDTGIIPTYYHKVELEIMYRYYSTVDVSFTPFGTMGESWGKNCFALCVIGQKNNGGGYVMFGDKYSTLTSTINTLNQWGLVSFGRGSCNFFNKTSSVIYNDGKSPTYTMTMFTCRIGNSYTTYGGLGGKRIRWFTIKDENDALIRDFIPVKVGNVGCMYDRANPKGGPLGNGLYPNNGTGSFICGPVKT